MTIFRIRTSICALGLLALGAAQAQAQAQAQTPAQTQAQTPGQDSAGRIGFVATERLYAESKLAKAADSRIAAQFSLRDKDNRETLARLKKLSEKFDGEAANLDVPERTRRAREVMDLDKEVQRLDQAYRDDLQERKNYERSRIAERAYALIVQFAEQEKIDVVFRDALWSRPGIDITDNILRQLDR